MRYVAGTTSGSRFDRWRSATARPRPLPLGRPPHRQVPGASVALALDDEVLQLPGEAQRRHPDTGWEHGRDAVRAARPQSEGSCSAPLSGSWRGARRSRRRACAPAQLRVLERAATRFAIQWTCGVELRWTGSDGVRGWSPARLTRRPRNRNTPPGPWSGQNCKPDSLSPT